MEQQPLNSQPQQGDLNWRLSAHPITLLTFLGFRLGALLMYLFGVLFINNLYILPLPSSPAVPEQSFFLTKATSAASLSSS